VLKWECYAVSRLVVLRHSIWSELQNCTEVISVTVRYLIVVVGDVVIVNVYFLCVGTNDRLCICDELVNSFPPWLDSRNRVIGVDFNTYLDLTNPVSDLINQFTIDCGFSRCEKLFDTGSKLSTTYCNEA